MLWVLNESSVRLQNIRNNQIGRMSILNYQQSHLDCTKIESINKSQLVDLINNFTISYVDKLKKLMVNVDLQLFKLNSKIIACQSNLCILESRIASIPGLNLDSLNLSDGKSADAQDENQTNQTDQTDSRPIVNKEEESTNGSEQTESDQNKASKIDETNPELVKYKRMLAVGVPLGAVQIKMRTDGVDPDLLK